MTTVARGDEDHLRRPARPDAGAVGLEPAWRWLILERMVRFPFRTTWLSRLVLAPFRVARDGWVELGEQGFRVRFGTLFDREVPYAAIESVTPDRWPLSGGVGVRICAGRRVGIISSTGSVVRIRLRTPVRVPLAFGFEKSASELLLSVAEPPALVAALERRIRSAAA